MPLPPLVGPDGGAPTPAQIVKQLITHFPIFESMEIWHIWCKRNEITPEVATDLFSEAVRAKETWEARVDPNAMPEAMTGDALLSLDLPRPDWIIRNVIPVGGLVAISGRPGSYKSFFALWLAMRTASGKALFDSLEEPFFCDQVTKPTPTLFIEEENTTIITRDRYRGLQPVDGHDLHFRIDQGFKMQDEVWRTSLLNDVGRFKIGLIIMDPFSSVMGLKDENNNAEVAVVMDLIRKEFIAKGITVVFIHHPSKGDGEGKNLRGAGDILGKCDIQLHLEKDELDPKLVTVSFEKMRLLPPDAVSNFKMRLIGDDLLRDQCFRYLGSAKKKYEAQRDEMREEVKKFMQVGVDYHRSEVATGIGCGSTDQKFRGVWKSMLDEGLVYPTINKKFCRKM